MSGAQSPAPLSPPPRALSSHPREVLGCECHQVISSDQEAHYLGGGPQVTYFWPSQPGRCGRNASPAHFAHFHLVPEGTSAQKTRDRDTALGREGSLVTSALPGGENCLKLK